MKKILFILIFLSSVVCSAQIDKDQLALAINKADEANTEQLRSFIWKRKSDAFVEGVLKLTTITEFSFDADGKLKTNIVDAQTTVKKKGGLRGKIQKNAAEDKLDYVEKALDLALKYTFMTKGELIDFLGKATVTENNGIIIATASDVYSKGDKLTVRIEKSTNLYIHKKFSGMVGKDPVDGEISYEKFSSGVNHSSETVLNMPAEKMKINAVNQDYSKRVK
jgi:hypothetical protein